MILVPLAEGWWSCGSVPDREPVVGYCSKRDPILLDAVVFGQIHCHPSTHATAHPCQSRPFSFDDRERLSFSDQEIPSYLQYPSIPFSAVHHGIALSRISEPG